VAAAYDELKPGEVGLVVDSYGLLSICVDRGSAAAELGLQAGDPITIEPLDDGPPEGVVSPVDLRRRQP
jgi:S-adenosylmethionine hydrolase